MYKSEKRVEGGARCNAKEHIVIISSGCSLWMVPGSMVPSGWSGDSYSSPEGMSQGTRPSPTSAKESVEHGRFVRDWYAEEVYCSTSAPDGYHRTECLLDRLRISLGVRVY